MADFRVHCALEAFEKAGDDNPMRVGGVVSTDQLDKQGERIVQTGLDFSPFLAEGWFNDNHGQRTQDVVGYPTDAKYVKKGEHLPNGKTAEANGWWAEGYLLNTDEGRKLWGLASALSKSPRRLGFSIEGRVSKRHDRDQNTITRAIVKNVAVTHCPVNPGTELVTLAKALMAGDAIANPGVAPGEGFALRAESLEGAPPPTKKPRKFKEAEEEELEDNPEALGKAETSSPPDLDVVVDESAIVEDWAPYISRSVQASQPPPTRLTKAEARIIVRSAKPHLSDAQVDAIVNRASLR